MNQSLMVRNPKWNALPDGPLDLALTAYQPGPSPPGSIFDAQYGVSQFYVCE